MKSILFIMNYSIHNTSRRKYDDQMRAAARLGYDVFHLGLDDEFVYLCHGEEKTKIYKRLRSPVKSADENILYISLFKSVANALKIKSDFDYCYVRRYYIEAAAYHAFKLLKNHGVHTIIEIPTYPHKNEAAKSGMLGKILSRYGEHYEKKSARVIDLFCPMGEHTDEICGAPALNIENGIDTTDIKLRAPKLRESEYHIIALALMTYWHGYDRLITGLSEYIKQGGKEKIYIHLAGDGAILEKWRTLAEELCVSEFVIFEGRMNNARMNEEFDKYDLGAASLGRYRSGLSVVYELKTREYMARGLPFIYATDDYVINDFGKYCLRVPNDDTPIDMNALAAFMKEMKHNKVAPAEMRKYAEEKMSFDIQFKRIFDWFENRAK